MDQFRSSLYVNMWSEAHDILFSKVLVIMSLCHGEMSRCFLRGCESLSHDHY